MKSDFGWQLDLWYTGSMKMVIALGFGLQVLLGPSAAIGMTVIPVRMELVPIVAAVMMSPLPLEEEENTLACAETAQGMLQASGAHSACPTDRCIAAQDDDMPTPETALAFHAPLVGNPGEETASVPWETFGTASRGNIEMWDISPRISFLSTVVLRV